MNKPNLKKLPEYFHGYISEVIDKDILEYLSFQKHDAAKFFNSIDEEKSLYKYAEGKWSIKEILGHICDAERIFAIRALQFARNEKQQLLGFDENEYADAANFSKLPWKLLIDDFIKMRESHISLFGTFTDELWRREGIAENKEYAVETIPYLIAGHLDHHIKVIKKRYL